MPIRAENRDRYPENWREIRERILERAGHRCERCGVPNRQWRQRRHGDGRTRLVNGPEEGDGIWKTATQVVLTIAHWPVADPEECSDWNLWALCNACHLFIDQDIHRANNADTRRRRKAVGTLPGLEL